ncbi:CENP-B homolog protein 2-like [Rhizophagus irregularis DAOM 181602=DAOM 197198]|uniref:DDE-1 domain-containing protein n=1 Tax=Rhizophagus irregularis (strain DAOM 197198w) TaxID=1432141 RepID=A0A015L3G4_RHIIW|nr:hypothetical protein RirG_118630 [Rhizophagus irregularis DAOM 197198w]GET66867.1 CENP-B homolog protein 2-like [Rhizophagus irregularis DAOM 181602=DAOM 197198]
MDVLQAIRYIIPSWNEVTVETIRNCWNHTGILPDNEYDETDNEDDDQMIDELSRTIQALNLPNVMRVKEFLNIPEEDITYEIFEDDQIIMELIDIFKNSYENTEDLDKINDNDEIVTISTNIALKSLETVNMFLLQQENTEEYIKLIGKIEKFIRKKQVHMMQQTTIDRYFN